MRQRQRRFLAIAGHPDISGLIPTVIMQGYLLNQDGYTVRVRRLSVPVEGGDEFGMVGIRGPRAPTGERMQEEFAFDDVSLAGQVLRRCRWKVLKRRYQLHGQVALDVFDWDNHGLVIAEVHELSRDLDQGLPSWLGVEITGETVFNNEWLARRPWSSWTATERGVWT